MEWNAAATTPANPPASPGSQTPPPRRDSTHLPPDSPRVSHRWPRIVRGRCPEPRQIMELEMVARDGIEPSTRGFSVRRRARFGASKPKSGDASPPRRPNRPTRPSLCRTGTGNSGRARSVAHAGQRLARIATEPFPNRQPNWAALGFGSLAPVTSRPAPPNSPRFKAMGWTPPHTCGIECQTGVVRQPVTE